MIARIDQENSIWSVNDDSRRLAGRIADRINAGKFSTVEVQDAALSGRLASSNECAHEHAIDLWRDFGSIEPGLREPFAALCRGIDPGWLDVDRLKSGRLEFCAIVRLLQCTRDASGPQFDMAPDFGGNFTASDHVGNGQA